MLNLPRATRALIIANVAVYFAEAVWGGDSVALLALWPLGPDFMPWQLLTYAFVHAGPSHLLFNAFGIYMFGGDLERVWGERRYLVYYLVCALSAAVAQTAVTSLTGTYYPTVGASGAIFGLLLAYAMTFPTRTLMLLFPPIPMRAPIFVGLYAVLELLLGVTGSQVGVAHFAHLGGLAGGYLLMRGWRGTR